MLGENLGTISGPTSMKALPAINGSPVFETVASGLTGTLAGAEVTSFATYSARMRADGSFQGECPNSGVIMTSDGVATFSATGVGSPTEDGGFVFKGVVYFETTAPSLSSLNPLFVLKPNFSYNSSLLTICSAWLNLHNVATFRFSSISANSLNTKE